MNEVTAIAEINFHDGKREIEMILKQPEEIRNCDGGKVVSLLLKDKNTYTGFFQGIDDDDDIVVGGIDGKGAIGLKVAWVESYFEEIKS